MNTTPRMLKTVITILSSMFCSLPLLRPTSSFAVPIACGTSPTNICPDQLDPPPCEDCDSSPGDDDGCDDCDDDSGMARWRVSMPNINLHLEDTPIHYQPSRGAQVRFHISYRQRGAITEDPAVFGVGTNWSCLLRAFLTPVQAST